MKFEENDDMTAKQYNSLKESINELRDEVKTLNEAVKSVEVWITGDDNLKSSGTAHIISDLRKKVDEHETFINKFKASLAILSVIAGSLGFVIGLLVKFFGG